MEQNIENKLILKDRLANFYNQNRLKIFFLISVLLISVIFFSIVKYNSEKKTILISEKYIQAGLYLAKNKKENAKNIYEEIIASKNKFYSILALNTIIEKDLITDKDKIMQFFDMLERSNLTSENIDLLILKKALYLIKISDIKPGNDLLKTLKNKNSSLKLIAEELLSK
tara:strand:- start:4660 stop:5169 length:510 start_codon:yes stop_codon:yes gene_type:complete